MKVLKPGDEEAARPWPMRRVFECKTCKAQLQPESKNEYRMLIDRNETFAVVVCSFCKNEIWEKQ